MSRPLVSVDQANKLLVQLYGIEAEQCQELDSYGDRNFHMSKCRGSHEGDFVLKVYNAEEDHAHLEVGTTF